MKIINIVSYWTEHNRRLLLAAFTSESEANALADYFLGHNDSCVDCDVYVDQVELDPGPETWSEILEGV